MAITWGPPAPVETETADAAAVLVDGYQVDAAAAWRVLRVWTANSDYEIAVEDAARLTIRINGGRHFPEACSAVLAGARESATEIRLGGICVGRPLMIYLGGKMIVTSAVRRVEVVG